MNATFIIHHCGRVLLDVRDRPYGTSLILRNTVNARFRLVAVVVQDPHVSQAMTTEKLEHESYALWSFRSNPHRC